MMEQIFPRVACLQMPLQQGDVDANLKEFRGMLAAACFAPDTLVVLPELWATGFDYANIGTLAEQTPQLLAELRQKAARAGIWFAGSLPEKTAAGKIYNSLFVVGPEGVAGRYQNSIFSGSGRRINISLREKRLKPC